MDNTLLATQSLKLSSPEMLVNLLVATVLGLLTAMFYKHTHKGVSYSRSFVTSLVMITVSTSIVIMVIGNSLSRAFGLLGAFALVRFRTAVKDTRDISYLFVALVMGLAAGSGAHEIAVLGFVVVMALAVILDRVKFGQMNAYEYVLSFSIAGSNKNEEQYKEVFGKYLKESMLLSARSKDDGKMIELSFNIRLKSDSQMSEFTRSLTSVKTVSRVELISTAGDVEY